MTSAAKRAGRNTGSVVFVFLMIVFVTWRLIQNDEVSPPVPSANLQPSSMKIVEGLFGFQDAIAWSPDSRFVVLGTHINGGKEGKVFIFDSHSGKNILIYDTNTNGIKTIAWSPDGRRIAAGTSERTVQVIDVAAGQRILTVTGKNKTFSDAIELAWSPDGRYLAESSDRHLRLRDPDSGDILWTIVNNDAHQLSWSPDGKSLGVSVQINSMVMEVQIWDIRSGENSQTLRGDLYSGRVFAWSPDGQRIARPYAFGVVQVWGVQTGTLLLTHGKNEPASRGVVRSVDWSPDGRYIASDSIEIWDANTGETVMKYKSAQPVNRLLWSPDGKYIMAAEDRGTLEIWEAPK